MKSKKQVLSVSKSYVARILLLVMVFGLLLNLTPFESPAYAYDKGAGKPLPSEGLEAEKSDLGYKEGSLLVSISPEEACADGGQWRVDEGDWQVSGSTIGGLKPGFHLVEFESPPLWQPVQERSVRIVGERTSELNVTFVPVRSVNIGDISPQRVWQGSTIRFRVCAEDIGSAATYTLSADPHPGNCLTFDTDTGLLSFSPGKDDNTPFEATFSARAGTDEVSQTVLFTPMPHLSYEQEVIGLGPVEDAPPKKTFISYGAIY